MVNINGVEIGGGNFGFYLVTRFGTIAQDEIEIRDEVYVTYKNWLGGRMDQLSFDIGDIDQVVIRDSGWVEIHIS